MPTDTERPQTIYYSYYKRSLPTRTLNFAMRLKPFMWLPNTVYLMRYDQSIWLMSKLKKCIYGKRHIVSTLKIFIYPTVLATFQSSSASLLS